MTDKKCAGSCGEIKNIEEFSIRADNNKSNGKCKKCVSDYYLVYRKNKNIKIKECKKRNYENNKEQILVNKKIYYENNKEQILDHQKHYYYNNKNKLQVKNKKYYNENKDTLLQKKKTYRVANKQHIVDHNKQYVKKWIDFYIPSIDLYIQVDGVYWHGINRPKEDIALQKTSQDIKIYKQILRDEKLNQYMKENKFKLLRITDEQINNMSDEAIINYIKEISYASL